MKTNTKINALRVLTLMALLSTAILVSSAHAAEPNDAVTQQGDPARWYQEEMTPMAYFKTLKKEAEAVYQESSIACKQMGKKDAGPCLRAAKETLQQDMAAAYSKSGIRAR
ncbi:hypothetical protein H8L32_21130 [Undibacterium sp. CY18W]|uniref:Uncharacterized protein n=1 Tax=Undibacterium hunanense TaxID=2762292 RepID=A0ABR6ZVT9_9BURK|nr:hypothetical protein [Undibacterium hunanense]MBC3919987.1 hypothetical protein [Undibacterium hunanense]